MLSAVAVVAASVVTGEHDLHADIALELEQEQRSHGHCHHFRHWEQAAAALLLAIAFVLLIALLVQPGRELLLYSS